MLLSRFRGTSKNRFFRLLEVVEVALFDGRKAFRNKRKVVRSTLLHLPARGSLRAKSGGPLVTVFFRLQTDFLMVQKASRNKSFFV